MADLNAGIIAGINPPPNLAQQQAQQAELAQRQAQTQREQQLAQIGAYELTEKKQAAADTAAAKQIFAKYGGDLEKSLPELMSVSPSLGISLQKSIGEGKKLQLELATSKLAHDKAVLGYVGQQLNGVKDETSYLRAVTSLHAAGIPTDDWPDDYDKGFVEQHQQVAMTVKEKLDQEDKRIDDARQLADKQSLEKHRLAEEEHQRRVDEINANDKLTDNQRQAAMLQETIKHDRAMEARPVGGASGVDVDPKAIADAIRRGEQPPTTQGLYRYGGAVRSELAKAGYNLAQAQTDWTATQKHIATLNNAQQTRLNQSINQLPDLLDSVDALASKWKGGRFPVLNSANLAAARNGVYGKDAASLASQLSTQIADVTGDLGTVYMGGNSPTDEAIKLAKTALSADWDEKVLHDMVALAKKNVVIRQNSIRTTGVQGASLGNPYDQPPPATNPPPTPTVKPTGRFNPATGKVER